MRSANALEGSDIDLPAGFSTPAERLGDRAACRRWRVIARSIYCARFPNPRSMFYQGVSLAGALLILVAYIALQIGWMSGRDRSFNIMNFVGSALLAWVAVIDWRVGFIVLEGAWALISLAGIFRRSESATPQS